MLTHPRVVDSESGEIVPFADGFVPAPSDKIEYTSTALVFKAPLSWDEWAAVGSDLHRLYKSVHWWIGDWLRYGSHTYGEKYVQAVEATGFSTETLKRDQWVASRFQPAERRPDLTFNHHIVVAALDAPARNALLAKAVEHEMSSRELRESVKVYKAATEEDVPEIPPPGPAWGDPPEPNGFTPRTEVSVIEPAQFDSHTVYHIWDHYKDHSAPDATVCAECGRVGSDKPSEDGSSIVLLQQAAIDQDGNVVHCVEIKYCLRCLFALALKAGKGVEVYA